ncbi:Poly [ADP-ribose] polymerase 3, partial [Paramuricea clavata]
GTGGQSKLDGPLSQANAEKIFKKKFLEKTKNSWDKRQQFVAVKGKYTLVLKTDSSQSSQVTESQKPDAFLSEVQQLPVELLRYILLQLPVRDVLLYMQVCKYWK